MKELSLHILDIIQNSIAAGADCVETLIYKNISENVFQIKIEDNGKGMESSKAFESLDPFVTSRKTRDVGMGLPLLRQSARLCGGELNISSVPGEGTVVEAEFINDHIDRPPLGNIVETFVSLIAVNPHIDFIYRHKINENEFIFSTLKIKDKLDEVKINNSEILSWIRDYLRENLQKLRGGEL